MCSPYYSIYIVVIRGAFFRTILLFGFENFVFKINHAIFCWRLLCINKPPWHLHSDKDEWTSLGHTSFRPGLFYFFTLSLLTFQASLPLSIKFSYYITVLYWQFSVLCSLGHCRNTRHFFPAIQFICCCTTEVALPSLSWKSCVHSSLPLNAKCSIRLPFTPSFASLLVEFRDFHRWAPFSLKCFRFPNCLSVISNTLVVLPVYFFDWYWLFYMPHVVPLPLHSSLDFIPFILIYTLLWLQLLSFSIRNVIKEDVSLWVTPFWYWRRGLPRGPVAQDAEWNSKGAVATAKGGQGHYRCCLITAHFHSGDGVAGCVGWR